MLINHLSNHKMDLKEILCQVKILTTQINELCQNLNLTVNEIRTALESGECSTLEATCLNLIAAELEAALEKVQISRTQVMYKSPQLHPDFPNLTPQAKRRWKLKKKTLHKDQGKDIIVDPEILQAMQTLQITEAECRSIITKIVEGTQQEQIITALNQYLKQFLNLAEIPNLETLNAGDLNVTKGQYLLQTDPAIICSCHSHEVGIAAIYQALLNIAIQKLELYQQLQQANLQLEKKFNYGRSINTDPQ